MWEISPRSAGAPSRLPYGSGAFSLEGVYMAHINSDILRLGVDVGSTTVKAVALDPADSCLKPVFHIQIRYEHTYRNH